MKASTTAGSKCLPRSRRSSSSASSHRPGLLVGPRREQRVEDVAHRADAPHERDRLAGQALRVAAAVPALVVGEGDLLGHAHDRRARAREDGAPASAWRRMTTHSSSVSLPGLVRIASGTAILPTSCSRLAWRSVSASAAVRPSTSPTRSHSRPMRSRCRPGLLVARLGRGGEALDDLQLGLAQLGRALVHGLLERLVAHGEAVAALALGQVAGGDGRHRAEGEREERRGDRDARGRGRRPPGRRRATRRRRRARAARPAARAGAGWRAPAAGRGRGWRAGRPSAARRAAAARAWPCRSRWPRSRGRT